MSEAAAPTSSAAPAGGPRAAADESPSDGQADTQPTAAEVRKHKIKVYGKEEELDEPTVIRYAQKARAGEVKLDELSKREKAQAEREAKLKDKAALRDLLKEHGHDPDALAEEWLTPKVAREMELSQLTPEARRVKELEEKLAAREKADAEKAETEQKTKAEQERATRVKAQTDQLADLFLGTMEKAGLPKEVSRTVMRHMASFVAEQDELGLEVSPEEAAAHVSESVKAEHKVFIESMPVEQAIAWLGPKFMNAVRKHDLAQLRAARTSATPAFQPPIRKPVTQPRTQEGTYAPTKSRWDEINALIKGKG